jgi:hypothetical protein
MYAVPEYSNEVTKIKLNSCSFLPPDVANSITIPYAIKEPMMPIKHTTSQIIPPVVLMSI